MGANFCVIIADRDSTVTNRLGSMVTDSFPGSRIYRTESPDTALEYAETKLPHIIIASLSMLAEGDFALAKSLQSIGLETIILASAGSSDLTMLGEANGHGIIRFIMNNCTDGTIKKVLPECARFSLLDDANTRIKSTDRSAIADTGHGREVFLEALFSETPNIVYSKDLSGRLCQVNATAAKLIGKEPTELAGLDETAFLSLDAAEKMAKIDSAILRSLRAVNFEKNIEINGKHLSLHITKGPLRNTNGDLMGTYTVAKDISWKRIAAAKISRLNAALSKRAETLQAANNELRATNEMLSTFNYTVSHDLRRPLANVHVIAQAILSIWGKSLDAQICHYLRDILANVTNLDNLIRSLLKFAQTSNKSIVREPVDLTKIAQDITYPLAIDTSRSAQFKIHEGLTASCDPDLIRDVLENLIGNAWKYSAKADTAVIEVGAEARGKEHVFYVRDNGAGFDMTNYEKIFKPFERLHTKDEFEGHGIGLATVEKIVGRHKGKIWAESKPGTGATFFFTLGSKNQGKGNDRRKAETIMGRG